MDAAIESPGEPLRPASEPPADIDPTQPVEIAEGIWWVGHHLDGDPFQCHVFLIEAGDQSVLIDPGSALTFPDVLRKVGQVTPFHNIRYFICHHQDPDITGALPLIEQIVSRKDAVIVTHWRAETLLKHYGLRLAFWRVEDNDWLLRVGRHSLRFVFTPYLHFPGAFCTFDETTGVLFSSDLFGGFTREFRLYAEDEGHFEAIRPFHEHYMPSREILAHGLARLEALPIRMIAPQHGSIIPERLVTFMIERLKELDCGLYLLVKQESDIQKLMRLNEVMQGITQTMVLYRDFASIAPELLRLSRKLMPVSSLEFLAATDQANPGEVLHLTPSNRYRGLMVVPPPRLASFIGIDRQGWAEICPTDYMVVDRWPVTGPAGEAADHRAIVIPLFAPDRQIATAVAVMHLSGETEAEDCIEPLIRQMVLPLQVAVERESIYRALDLERQNVYERLIRDPLTGLFTRVCMQDTILRMFDLHDRDPDGSIAVLMIDIDHFKSVNDEYGHVTGDTVLRTIARAILNGIRRADLPVRFGGEEFAVFCPGLGATAASTMAERLRASIERIEFEPPVAGRRVTISIGTAIRRRGEDLATLIGRADHALYAAKASGRNCTITAGDEAG